jgi:hypothetical protein
LASPAAKLELASYLKTIPSTTNPSQLSDFNYTFSEENQRLETMDDLRLGFHYVSEQVNQKKNLFFPTFFLKHYTAMGDLIVKEIQNKMVQMGLEEVLLPRDEKAQTNVFVSPNLASFDKVALVIQGSGAVRPGQWARALCLNEGLKTGSILEYL